jgi:hypothetical protein
MLFGIWVTGPVCMSYYSGGYFGGRIGPQNLHDWWNVAKATAVFPLSTWQMAASEGTLSAVGWTTLLLCILALWAECGRPRLRSRLRAHGKTTWDDGFCFARGEESGEWTLHSVPNRPSITTEVMPAPPIVGRGDEVSPLG